MNIIKINSSRPIRGVGHAAITFSGAAMINIMGIITEKGFRTHWSKDIESWRLVNAAGRVSNTVNTHNENWLAPNRCWQHHQHATGGRPVSAGAGGVEGCWRVLAAADGVGGC